MHNKKNCFGYFFGKFWKYLAIFSSYIWPHWTHWSLDIESDLGHPITLVQGLPKLAEGETKMRKNAAVLYLGRYDYDTEAVCFVIDLWLCRCMFSRLWYMLFGSWRVVYKMHAYLGT